MPKLALTRMKMPKGQAQRWRKKYKGKTYYFRGAYADAVKQWERQKVELDGQDKHQYEVAIQNRKEIELAIDTLNDYWVDHEILGLRQTIALSPEGLALLAEIPSLEQLEETLTSGDRLPLLTKKDIAPYSFLPTADKELIRAGMERWEQLNRKDASTSTEITTIGQAVDEWLAWKKSQVIMGHIKQATLSSTTVDIAVFRKWAKDSTPLASITEKLLFDFFNHLAGEIGGGRMAKGYAHQIMLYTKSFVKRQWELHRIELPRNFGSRDISIRVPTGTVDTLTVEEIKAFYNRGTSLLKTCILLSLNCGFNQIDIATLAHSEVDWEKGTITKRRSKTGGYDNVPTVQWKLWNRLLPN